MAAILPEEKSCTKPRTSMTSKERMLAALRGEAVDRVPIWLREGFPIFSGPAEKEDFTCGWQAEPLYRELFDYVAPYAEPDVGWGVPGMNRSLLAPPSCMEHETVLDTPECKRTRTVIHTPRGDLEGLREIHRNESTVWKIQETVRSEEHLRMLQEVPFEVDPDLVARAKENYRNACAQADGKILPRLFLSSPVVCISGCMEFELFLELSLTEREWFREMCRLITDRQLAILEKVFDEPMETLIVFGGSEQCTPPMMAPRAFDEYVVPYDGELIRFFKDRGLPVQIHCHGKVRHALSCMVEMGADATDPVEPPPAGDVTYAEAREIVGDKLTLVGNLEWDMLETATPAQVRAHVKEILSLGNRRLILSASAGPISAITPRLADNYRAWVDAALEFGA